MATLIHIGDEVGCEAVFKNRQKEPIDPTAVFFKVRKPNKTIISYEYGVSGALVRDSTGKYRVQFIVDASGFWYYRFYSTGAGAAAFEGIFKVEQTNF